MKHNLQPEKSVLPLQYIIRLFYRNLTFEILFATLVQKLSVYKLKRVMTFQRILLFAQGT